MALSHHNIFSSYVDTIRQLNNDDIINKDKVMGIIKLKDALDFLWFTI